MATVFVVLRDDLDVSTADGWRAQIEAAIDDPATTRVVLDLARLRFVDSSGLGLLLTALERAGERDVELALRRPPAQLERLMAMTQTYALFRWEA